MPKPIRRSDPLPIKPPPITPPPSSKVELPLVPVPADILRVPTPKPSEDILEIPVPKPLISLREVPNPAVILTGGHRHHDITVSSAVLTAKPATPKPEAAAQSTTLPTIEERNAQVSKKLAERYDALNQAIIAAEQKLKALKPPLPVWVMYNFIEIPNDYGAFEVIGMTKVDNQWRLAHGVGDDPSEEYDPRSVQPLTDCSMEVRIQAVEHLHQLQAVIVKRKEEFVPRVEEALKKVLNFCQGVQS